MEEGVEQKKRTQDRQPSVKCGQTDTEEEGESEIFDSSQEVSSGLDGEADECCHRDEEDEWLDKMLSQLGLPRCQELSGGAAAVPPVDGREPAPVERDLDELRAEEHYHRELRDVLWTIMRAAWKLYERNTKTMDALIRDKERALGRPQGGAAAAPAGEPVAPGEKICAAPAPS
ncbi:hypothetical protein HPB48_008376 [Haemaphysalis longicornis]|uniref:Uncharacterized protein n=1 Tax=Haemaphysalis longicornis TaxID=44386 RepID=A0A9J6F6V7_HAELO|nr:hypothetical protein HPB48_008376 [Haemaphysalis longicornis]